MIKDLVQGRLFDHPIHPMLVHFPTALFTVSFLFDMAGVAGFGRDFYSAAVLCMGAGVAGGFLAVVSGSADYIKLAKHAGEPVLRKASRHGFIQLVVLILFATLFGLRYDQLSRAPVMLEGVVSGLGVLLMLTGNYLGGDLVFRDGVGVKKYAQDRSERADR